MIDAGQLKVTIRNGRMLIVLPTDVLFDSGRTDLKPAGKTAMTQVAQALATIRDRRFLVSGHTDNVPIKTSRFPSNWELSTARAVEVAKLLVAGGMKPDVLGAAGYAEFDPVAQNDTPQNKALNRRIEIILEPNLSDLPNLDTLADGEQGEMTARHRRPQSLAVLAATLIAGRSTLLPEAALARRKARPREGAQADGGGSGGRRAPRWRR